MIYKTTPGSKKIVEIENNIPLMWILVCSDKISGERKWFNQKHLKSSIKFGNRNTKYYIIIQTTDKNNNMNWHIKLHQTLKIEK